MKKQVRKSEKEKNIVSEKTLGKIGKYFSELEDPRIERTKKHLLIDVIGLTLIAVISGCNSWVEIEEFGKTKEAWLKKYLSLAGGIPSHDTIGRVFSLLDAQRFEMYFIKWTQDILSTAQSVIAIDGKSLRGSACLRKGKKAIHMVSAFSCKHGLVLGQVKTKEKSNEIKAIPQLLDMLDLKGSVITIDAMGCQKDIAKQIVEAGGDFVFGLKGNQGNLHKDVKSTFTAMQTRGFKQEVATVYEVADKAHGRKEKRTYTIMEYRPAFADLCMIFGKERWAGVASIAMVKSERITGSKKREETRYYISSLQNKGEEFSSAIREHWGIENKLHWMLDVTFKEDHSQVREKNAAENFSIIRRIALNMLKKEKTYKASINCKRLKAGWDGTYLMKVLAT